MTKSELAKLLNICEYGEETTPEIQRTAKENGLVIVFGFSDDNAEFQGAIEEEIPCWQGRKIFFNKDGSNFTDEDGGTFLTYHKEKEAAEPNCIEAVWCEKEKVYHGNGDYYSWTFKTDLPHETFDVMEDGNPFCRGIIFSISACR